VVLFVSLVRSKWRFCNKFYQIWFVHCLQHSTLMLRAAGVWPDCRFLQFCWARQSEVVGRQHASRFEFTVAAAISNSGWFLLPCLEPVQTIVLVLAPMYITLRNHLCTGSRLRLTEIFCANYIYLSVRHRNTAVLESFSVCTCFLDGRPVILMSPVLIAGCRVMCG